MSLLILIAATGLYGWFFVFRLQQRRAENWLWAWYVGLWPVGMCVTIGAIESMAWATRMLFAVLAIAVAMGWMAYRKFAKLSPKPEPRVYYAFTPLERISLMGILAVQFLALLSVLAPSTAWDAGVAHLALPQDYAREGQIYLVIGNPYSGYPHLLHSLYGYLYHGGGEWAVSIFSWLMGVFACLSVFVLGRRLKDRETGWVAAGFASIAPIFIQQAGTVSIDLAFAGMVTAALAAWLAWHDERNDFFLVIAAMIAGLSCGIRHTGYVVCALLLILTIFSDRKLKSASLFSVLSLLIAGPYLIRSNAMIGNPVYPFLANVFGGGSVPDVQSVTPGSHETLGVSGVFDFLLFPWNIVMHPERFDGWSASPGGWVLILGLPGLYWAGRRGGWIAGYSGGGLVFFYFFQRFARYMLPFFMPLYAAAGVTATQVPVFRRGMKWLLVFGVAYSVVLGVGSVYFKVPVVLGLESREDYLMRRVERYPAFQWVNDNIPHDETVFSLDPRTYYMEGRTFMNFQVLHELGTLDPDAQVDWLASRGIRYVLYPVAYLEESPGYAATGLLDVMQPWRDDPKRFALLADLEMDRARGSGTEHVEIYEVMRREDETP